MGRLYKSVTITNSTTLGVLVAAYGTIQSGVTITSTQAGSRSAIQCIGYFQPPGMLSPTVVNNGVIVATVAYSNALEFESIPPVNTSGPPQYYPGTLVNNCTIIGGTRLYDGGVVTNYGTIEHNDVSGMLITDHHAATVRNFGAIVGFASASSGVGVLSGIQLNEGGTVLNYASGTIFGQQAITNFFAPITVVNYGQVSGQWGIEADKFGDVTNGIGGTIAGSYVGIHFNETGTVFNAGIITGVQAINGAPPPQYTQGKTNGGPLTITNLGTIAANEYAGAGILLRDGGVVVNGAGAAVQGEGGVALYSSGGTCAVTNTGTIGYGDTSAAIESRSPGSVVNGAGGTIQGGDFGVDFGNSSGAVTILNAGTIASPGTHISPGTIDHLGAAIRMSFYGTNILALVPGYAIIGKTLAAGSNPDNVIELTSAASVGTITGIGARFRYFTLLGFDPGAQWSVSMVPDGLGNPVAQGLISGFAHGDTIELTGVTATETLYNAGVLTVAPGVTLNFAGAFSAADFQIANTAAGADITVACFARGTRIATPTGSTPDARLRAATKTTAVPLGTAQALPSTLVPIENLKPGDLVLSAFGGTVPIQWIGHRTIDISRHPTPKTVWPIRIQAHALANNIPSRDLYVSPEHALHLDGHLIPAHLLVNGTTITQVPRTSITYFHLELPQHDVILAENTECETYLDTNNRNDFENTDGPITLHPNFTADAQRSAAATKATASAFARESAPLHPAMTADELWRSQACAPQCRQGPLLDAIRTRLNRRASHPRSAVA